ncbi:MAG TPA: AAA family ATPase [Pyrinomonadaceae bacterium]|jgi:adenylate kinase family enzyme|nr:AAA family ATPase [Pyrinomonadaceae bacterium]
MKKVLIIGPSGSGKSTLSRKLGTRLGIEVLHLDRFYWSSGWTKPPADKWLQTVNELLRRDSLIIDGNYSGTLVQRIEACDTIIFLDFSTVVCLWRVVKRWLVNRNATRPDMAEGCPEKIDIEFIRWVLGYSRRTRPKVVRLIQENAARMTIVWLRTQREVDTFVGVDSFDV